MTASFARNAMVAALGLGLSSSAVHANDDRDKDEDKPVVCVEVTAEARHSGIGYNHLVHLANECTFSVECSVRTNVNEKPQHVTVPSKEKKTVVTWRNSPAREFTPYVSCLKAK